MKTSLAVCVAIVVGFGILGSVSPSRADESVAPAPAAGEAASELRLETLLAAPLEGIEHPEVIVSRVTIPPHTALPRHRHPGEEFGYVLEGSVTLWQEGKADVSSEKGDVVRIPMQQVHTAITGAEGATILVFRVHPRGQPERILVD